MKYSVIRTDTADSQIHEIVLRAAENFGKSVALEVLHELEESLLSLSSSPYMGMKPKYPVLRRQGYRVLIMKKNLCFYKVNDSKREVVIYAVVDQRQDYLSLVQGL